MYHPLLFDVTGASPQTFAQVLGAVHKRPTRRAAVPVSAIPWFVDRSPRHVVEHFSDSKHNNQYKNRSF